MTDVDDSLLAGVLADYGFTLHSARRAGHGLINATWVVRDPAGATAVLQRLHPIIDDGVNARINAVADCLVAQGLRCPRVIASCDGELSVTREQARWRLLTYIEGMAHDTLSSPRLAAEAGAMLGRFHLALRDPGLLPDLPASTVHGLNRHVQRLRRALEQHRDHREFARIEALAEPLLEAAVSAPAVPATPLRIVHGDPKISNFLFDREERAVCLVDLDTIGAMPLVFELGDAFRSWCNPAGEDTVVTTFSLPLLRAAVDGYASTARSFIEPDEVRGIVPAIEAIYIELAARFCTDALEEAYFAWDPARFDSHCEHNLVRAGGQLHAAHTLAAVRDEASQIVMDAFAGEGA
ncbi:MAG: phosphotransferase enzyme family protein [Gammaproteobacteria bacterium]